MSANPSRHLRPTSSRRASRLAAALVGTVALSGVALGGTRAAGAAAPPLHAPVVTRAALDPALVDGRGADVDFVEQEAENAVTDGTVLGAGKTDVERRAAYTLTAEASGRDAVALSRGQYVEFTLTESANAINVRYSIPDAPTGGGLRSPLEVSVNGKPAGTMTLTSEYAWLYAMYPFSNDPDAGPTPG